MEKAIPRSSRSVEPRSAGEKFLVDFICGNGEILHYVNLPTHGKSLKIRIPVLALAISVFLADASPPVILPALAERRDDLQGQIVPFRKQIFLQNIEVGPLQRPKIVTNRSSMQATPPFGLDENEAFPWSSAEKVVIGLLKIKSGGKRNRANTNVPYFSYSLEIDPLLILRGKEQLNLQIRRKGDLRAKTSNALRTLSQQVKGPASALDIVKTQRKLDKLLAKEDDGNLPKDLKYVRGSYYGVHKVDPEFPDEDQLVLIALTGTSSTKRLAYWQPINVTTLDHVVKLIDLPYGWSLNEDGEPLSPWSGLGNQAHMGDDEPALRCDDSERGFSPADEGLTLMAGKIPAEFQNSYNRDGNGYFRLSLRNPTEFPLSIPALRRNKEGILWRESLVCLISTSSGATANAVCLPRFSSLQELKDTEATVLEPGEEVSTIVNPLLFSSFPSISGYSQLTLRFCLGKTFAQSTFYFNSSYHEKIRLKLKAGVPTRPISLAD